MNDRNEYRLMCRWLAVGVFGGAVLASIALAGEISRFFREFSASAPAAVFAAICAAFYIAHYLAKEGK